MNVSATLTGVIMVGLVATPYFIKTAVSDLFDSNCEVISSELYSLNGTKNPVQIDKLSATEFAVVTSGKAERFEMDVRYKCFGIEFNQTVGPVEAKVRITNDRTQRTTEENHSDRLPAD